MLYELAEAVITKYPRLGGLNSRDLCLSTGGWKSGRHWQGWFLARAGLESLCWSPSSLPVVSLPVVSGALRRGM